MMEKKNDIVPVIKKTIGERFDAASSANFGVVDVYILYTYKCGTRDGVERRAGTDPRKGVPKEEKKGNSCRGDSVSIAKQFGRCRVCGVG